MNALTTLASEQLSTFIAPSSSAESVVSSRHLSYGRSWRASRRLVYQRLRYTNFRGPEQILQQFPSSQKVLGKPSMRKQCVPGSFLPAHTSLGMRLLRTFPALTVLWFCEVLCVATHHAKFIMWRLEICSAASEGTVLCAPSLLLLKAAYERDIFYW